MDLLEKTRKLFELLKVEIRSCLELSVTKSDKEGESKLEVSNPNLRQTLWGFGSGEGLGMDSSDAYFGIDGRTSLRKNMQ